MHIEHLEFINDNVHNKPLHIIHGATGILVVVVIMVVVVGIIVIRRKLNLLQQMLPFFLLNNNMSSHSQRTQHEDRRQQPEPGEPECGSPTPTVAEQPLELAARQPVGQAAGESGSVYAGWPSKPRRNLTLNLPPVRFAGDRVDLHTTSAVEVETSEDLDSAGYLLPRAIPFHIDDDNMQTIKWVFSDIWWVIKIRDNLQLKSYKNIS